MHTFRTAQADDADRCFEIETAAYEGDEAATHQKIATRIHRYPVGFLILEIDEQVVGFINCGCAHQVDMSDHDFKELIGHDPDAPHVVVLSVVVDPDFQERGLSTALMAEFVARMRKLGKSSIQLMCREHHVALYKKFGYRYVRPSASEHGGMAWHEMVMTL